MGSLGRILGVSLAMLLIAAPAVHAQDDDMGDMVTKKPTRRQTVQEESDDTSRPGPMLGAGAAFALENFGNIGMSTDNSGAYNVDLGYRFNPWFAADMKVERYQEFDSRPGEVNGWAIGLNGRGYFLSGDYQPFALIGINYLDMETTNNTVTVANTKKTDDGAAMRFGLGFDWYSTPNFVVTTDISYMLGLGEVNDYDMVIFGLGFLYRP